MKTIRHSLRTVVAVLALISMCGFVPQTAAAHCDTMDGPVVAAAKTALENKNVARVLQWVRKDDEAEVREAFQKALAVRDKGAEARELADRFFFETVVRLHRAGEGAPYTGLKPAGTDLGPAVEGADKALAQGSADALVKLVTEAVAHGIRERFAHAAEAKNKAESSVEAGRQFVAAYVEFVHFVERLYLDATAPAAHHEKAEKELPAAVHKH